MSSGRTCRECGTAIPADSPGGFCAQCLLGLGLTPEDGAPNSDGGEHKPEGSDQPSQSEEIKDRMALSSPLTEKAGDRIGRYRLLQEIGHGGCGVVYMADTRQVVARFEAERQALALMDHPNIAKILDAGITEAPLPASGHPLPSSDEGRGQGEGSSVATRHSSLVTSAGRPYFVMELVGGIKITDYCDQHQLTTRQRLELFMQACRAIQHAHQKGIIHRDIKPSNVLVATQDGTAVPKVIDFGIAKATQGPLTDHTLFTAFEQFLGTPAYMSPEQAEVGGLDIDTRSDIYSLGVLLYELLTGKTPFDAKELLAAGLEAMRRTICEKEPPKPSTRLTQELALGVPPSGRRASEPPSCSGTSGVELAEAGTPNPLPAGATSSGGARTLHDTKELVKLLRGDLDWIVMKCLEKDRARRYETASGLARDIERHLNNEPVVASPPSNLYRFQKMVRRNKVLVSAGLGRTYLRLHQPEAAEPLLRKALDFNQRTYGEQSENAIESLGDMAGVVGEKGQKDEEERLLQQVLAMERKLHGNEHLHVARTLLQIAHVQSWNARGRYGWAERLNGVEATYRDGLALLRKSAPSDSPELIEPLVSLAEFLSDFKGRSAEAEALLREALPLQLAAYGQRNPTTAHILVSLAVASFWKQDFVEAERLCEQGIAIQREVLGTNDPALGGSLNTLGGVLQKEHKLPQSEAAFREALDIRRRTLHGNRDVAWSIKQLAWNLVAQKRFGDAQELFRETLAYWENEKEGGVGSEAYWTHLAWLTQMLKAQNKLDDIEALHRDVLDRVRKALDATHVGVPAALCQLGDFLVSRNQSSAATELYREAQELIPQLNSSGRNIAAAVSLVDSLRARGRLADAEKVCERIIQAESQNAEEPNFFLGHVLHLFGDLLNSQCKFEAAVEQFLKGVEIRRKQPDIHLQMTLLYLGSTLIDCGKPAEAEHYLREALALYRTLYPGEELGGTARPTKRLADALAKQGKVAEAEQAYREAIVSYRKCNATDTPDFRETVNSLSSLLKSEGKLSEAQAVLDDVKAQSAPNDGEKNPIAAP